MGVQPRKDSHFHSVPFRLRPLFALVLPVSNRHNHHLVIRETQEATQTKADSRRRHSERAKRHQTNPTQALGATPPPHTRSHSVQCHPTRNAVTRCMQIHYLSAQDVPGCRRSLAPSQRNRRNPQIQRISGFQSKSCKFHEFSRFPVFVVAARGNDDILSGKIVTFEVWRFQV